MVLATVVPIFLAYLNVNLFYRFKNSEDSTKKIIIGAFFVVLVLLSLFTLFTYFNQVKERAYGNVPYFYTLQWQEAMSWVRNSTATTAVFAHWWDYGYWVQSIGNRATVTDGGNLIVYWNYLTGRYVLTGDNQKTALEVLYSHNTTHLLIDSSDMGKYGAFSQIGSDENYDRLSGGPVTMFSDVKNIQELKDQTIRTYNIPAGNNQISITPLEEDISYNENGSKITIFKENSGIIGFEVGYSQKDNSTEFNQPQARIITNGKQITLPVRYLYLKNKMVDFKTGLEMAVYPIPRITSSNLDYQGALIYVSPRLMNGLLAQLYIFDDPFNNFDAFKLAHAEYDLLTKNVKSQKYDIDEFNYFDGYGLQGPIKIWEIKYKGDEKVKAEYTQKNFPSSITWQF
jgi:asparagine N-glycosylation enzyme membrane subunit Stt3